MILQVKLARREKQTKFWATGADVEWPEVPKEDQSQLRFVKIGTNYFLRLLSQLHDRYK